MIIALQYIHGIGAQKANEIMEKVGIPEERRVSQLTDQEVLQIREVIDRDYVVEGDLHVLLRRSRLRSFAKLNNFIHGLPRWYSKEGIKSSCLSVHFEPCARFNAEPPETPRNEI